MGNSKVKIFKDLISNFFHHKDTELFYIIESVDWSIKWDGKYITENLNKLGLITARTTRTHVGLRNHIVHFGSLNTFPRTYGFLEPDKSNKTILTIFHVVPGDKRLKFLLDATEHIDVIHTSCNITKSELIKLGLPQEKIVVIPLGVDVSLFKPVSSEKKHEMREQMGIPLDRIVIGSFQKDGVGWGEGLKPKLIKGPDIFVKVIENLSKNYPVFVLLVGPARGYVKFNLQKRNIPYKHVGYLKNLKEVAKYYNFLDLYLITSRIEGGPKQILEAWASGIPAFSSKVGMVADIAKDGENILLGEPGNINKIVEKIEMVIENENLKRELVKNGLKEVKKYRWENITRKYYQKIYSELL